MVPTVPSSVIQATLKPPPEEEDMKSKRASEVRNSKDYVNQAGTIE